MDILIIIFFKFTHLHEQDYTKYKHAHKVFVQYYKLITNLFQNCNLKFNNIIKLNIQICYNFMPVVTRQNFKMIKLLICSQVYF